MLRYQAQVYGGYSKEQHTEIVFEYLNALYLLSVSNDSNDSQSNAKFCCYRDWLLQDKTHEPWGSTYWVVEKSGTRLYALMGNNTNSSPSANPSIYRFDLTTDSWVSNGAALSVPFAIYNTERNTGDANGNNPKFCWKTDGSGVIHLLYTSAPETLGGDYDIYSRLSYATYTPGTDTWTQVGALYGAGNHVGYYPCGVEIDSSGRVHFFFVASTPDNTAHDVLYHQAYSSGTFRTAQSIANLYSFGSTMGLSSAGTAFVGMPRVFTDGSEKIGIPFGGPAAGASPDMQLATASAADTPTWATETVNSRGGDYDSNWGYFALSCSFCVDPGPPVTYYAFTQQLGGFGAPGTNKLMWASKTSGGTWSGWTELWPCWYYDLLISPSEYPPISILARKFASGIYVSSSQMGNFGGEFATITQFGPLFVSTSTPPPTAALYYGY